MRVNSPPFPAHNLIESAQHWAAAQPSKIVYTFLVNGEEQEQNLTYSQLDQQARIIAGRLQHDLLPGDRVILLFPSGLEFIVAFLGCLYAGMTAVPMPEPLQERHVLRVRSIVEDAQSRLILTSKRLLSQIQLWQSRNPELQTLDFRAIDEIETYWADRWQAPALDEHSLAGRPAFLQYTSGSTGVPRGVMITHDNLFANCRMSSESFFIDDSTVMISWLPLFHDLGLISMILLALFAGCRTVFMSPFAFLQKPLRWLRAVSRYRGEVSGGPNFAFALAARKFNSEQCADLDLSSWRVAFNGAEPVRAATLAEFSQCYAPYGLSPLNLAPCYGLAEATLMVSFGVVGRGYIVYEADSQAFLQRRLRPAAAGRPALTLIGCGDIDRFDQQICLVDPDTNRLCEADEIGEIWVAGRHIARGYWGKPEETAAVFHAVPSAPDGRPELAEMHGPFMRTGDLGFIHQGQLFIAGRLKDLIIVDGNNHYPQDIELTVEEAHPAVRKGCTAAFSIDRDDQEQLIVVIELRAKVTDVDLPTIEQTITSAISKQHGLRLAELAYIREGTIPKTSSGKIQRRACRTAYLANRLSLWQAANSPVVASSPTS